MSKVNYMICDFSFLIRKGLVAIIDEMSSSKVTFETSDVKKFQQRIDDELPDFVIVNPQIFKDNSFTDFLINLRALENTYLVALLHPEDEKMKLEEFYDILYLTDSKSELVNKIDGLNKKILINNPQRTKSELSGRETDVLKLIALGKTNKEIAEILFLSPHTVITHRKNITNRLAIKSVAGLTIYAVLNGLIEMNDVG